MAFILAHTSGEFMSRRGRTKNKNEARKFSTRAEAVAYKGDYVVSEEDPDYKRWSVVEVKDSAIDKAIRTVDANPESDFANAIQLLNQVESIAKKYGRKIDSAAIFNMIDSLKKKFDFYKSKAGRGWYDL